VVNTLDSLAPCDLRQLALMCGLASVFPKLNLNGSLEDHTFSILIGSRKSPIP
jgi:hypothetical protein